VFKQRIDIKTMCPNYILLKFENVTSKIKLTTFKGQYITIFPNIQFLLFNKLARTIQQV